MNRSLLPRQAFLLLIILGRKGTCGALKEYLKFVYSDLKQLHF